MGRIFRIVLKVALAILLLLLALIILWRFIPPVSTPMLARWAVLKPVDRQWVPLSRISPHLRAAAIMGEDAKFCRHPGVDWSALRDVMDDPEGPARGASTITMQTAKNLFLWNSRSYIRKGMEIPLALAIDFAWPKRRVLEVYLNIAEWGEGLYGAEAAARRYFGRSANDLTPRQAALLIAALPNPRARDPRKPQGRHARLAAIVERRARGAASWADCRK
ncbi:MAG: monofunctional biosynthetic peptidoglycan transglycosylase [Beijerinckiaceae bacterium]|nr:monofunctional biosynthetic peptidoglycan transglycosylase [Beijerinckiaceae bacterium]